MNTILIVCGAIVTISGAIAAVGKWVVKPINKISQKIESVDKMEKNQKALMRAQAQTMEHLISGNNVDQLRDEYNKLLQCIIDN